MSDGNILEIKLIVVRVVKHPEQLDELGMPKYTVQSNNIVRIRQPNVSE